MSFMLQILILAVVQGITEFLPISSSGHLLVLQNLMHSSDYTTPNVDTFTINILLHAASLLAIILYYFKRLILLFGQDRRMLVLLAIGTVPAVITGLVIKKTCQDILSNPQVTGCMFFITAALLIWSDFYTKQREKTGIRLCDCREMTYTQALITGLFQCVAVLPGLSRSGSTISGALLVGLKRMEAATFSFLLAIPVIGGACLLEILDVLKNNGDVIIHVSHIMPLAAGFITTFFISYVSLIWLMHWVNSGRLWYFSLWLIPMGIITLVIF